MTKAIGDPSRAVDPECSELNSTGEITKEVEKGADPVFDEEAAAFLSPNQAEILRLMNKPKIDHLIDAVYVNPETGERVPLFEPGDRVVVERHTELLPGFPWLDTRVFTVISFTDDTVRGVVRCLDEELVHYAHLGYKTNLQTWKFAPKKGNPFNNPNKRGSVITATPMGYLSGSMMQNVPRGYLSSSLPTGYNNPGMPSNLTGGCTALTSNPNAQNTASVPTTDTQNNLPDGTAEYTAMLRKNISNALMGTNAPKKKRGRPPGAKSRPKAAVLADKLARKEIKRAKLAKK